MRFCKTRKEMYIWLDCPLELEQEKGIGIGVMGAKDGLFADTNTYGCFYFCSTIIPGLHYRGRSRTRPD